MIETISRMDFNKKLMLFSRIHHFAETFFDVVDERFFRMEEFDRFHWSIKILTFSEYKKSLEIFKREMFFGAFFFFGF